MLEVLIEADGWAQVPLESLAGSAVTATLGKVGIAPEDAEISLLACSDARIADLNSEFRDKTTATNVLSWPAVDLAPDVDGARPKAPERDFDGTYELGDIAIAFETCLREAAEMQKSMEDHVTHLIVHGLLHLLGYDHVRDRDATLMEALETEILGKLGLDDPYRN
ncbi:rRNA maturation RNase YbeY [Roseobacter sp. EG26]|uniref:rRNA maturation RNase YbeY n=1 Tax=Roseobacter sp. EG26 TaxID=3412477 RepID=UPI003CE45791